MRKILSLLSTIILVFSISLSVNAQDSLPKVGEGYTKDGIYYEVFIVGDDDVTICSTSINVTRQVNYAGIVTPQTSIS